MSITTVESVALADFESEFDWSQIELLAEGEADLNKIATSCFSKSLA